jgi:hypothetical protein
MRLVKVWSEVLWSSKKQAKSWTLQQCASRSPLGQQRTPPAVVDKNTFEITVNIKSLALTITLKMTSLGISSLRLHKGMEVSRNNSIAKSLVSRIEYRIFWCCPSLIKTHILTKTTSLQRQEHNCTISSWCEFASMSFTSPACSAAIRGMTTCS